MRIKNIFVLSILLISIYGAAQSPKNSRYHNIERPLKLNFNNEILKKTPKTCDNKNTAKALYNIYKVAGATLNAAALTAQFKPDKLNKSSICFAKRVLDLFGKEIEKTLNTIKKEHPDLANKSLDLDKIKCSSGQYIGVFKIKKKKQLSVHLKKAIQKMGCTFEKSYTEDGL